MVEGEQPSSDFVHSLNSVLVPDAKVVLEQADVREVGGSS